MHDICQGVGGQETHSVTEEDSLWTHGLPPLGILNVPSLLHDRREYVTEGHALRPLHLAVSATAMAVRQLG